MADQFKVGGTNWLTGVELSAVELSVVEVATELFRVVFRVVL
jgi:hypothetical protein